MFHIWRHVIVMDKTARSIDTSEHDKVLYLKNPIELFIGNFFEYSILAVSKR